MFDVSNEPANSPMMILNVSPISDIYEKIVVTRLLSAAASDDLVVAGSL